MMRKFALVMSSLLFLSACGNKERIEVRPSDSPELYGNIDEIRETAERLALNVSLSKIKEIEAAGRFVRDPRVTGRATAAMQRVLASFPELLRETIVLVYEADFGQSEAFTFGDKTVLISERMVEALDAPGELEFVLAHELAHVEFQHHIVNQAILLMEQRAMQAQNASAKADLSAQAALQEELNQDARKITFRRAMMDLELQADRHALVRLRDSTMKPCQGSPLSAIRKVAWETVNPFNEILKSYPEYLDAWPPLNERKGHPALLRRLADLEIALKEVCANPPQDSKRG